MTLFIIGKEYHTMDGSISFIIKELCEVAAAWEDVRMMLNPNQEMIKLWLKQVNPQPSWSAFIKLFESLNTTFSS